MATSGTNYTAKWDLQNGVLTISPVSGNSGIMRVGKLEVTAGLDSYITLTDGEWESVTEIKFVNSVRFQYDASLIQVQYVAKTSFTNFFKKALNVTQIDVTGLNITGATGVWGLFKLDNLTTITGIANLDVSGCTDFTSMFAGSKIASLDISSFPASVLNNADSVQLMFSDMKYCTSITLPTNFQRAFSTMIYDNPNYGFGIASSRIPATKDGITISSDEDFFKLTTTSQGGTWTRDISGSAELKFNVNKVVRDGNSAEMQYTYYASSATVEVYLKETSQSSFPSTPSDTFSIGGTGTGSRTLTLSSDSAYDIMVKVYDGETTLYTYPSIDSNVLLFSVDEDGNAWARGDIEDGQGNVLAEKADTASLAEVATSGDYDDLSNKPTIPAVPDDYIISTGTTSGWSWRKWASGRMEAEKEVSTGSTWTSVASGFYYNQVTITPPSGMLFRHGYAVPTVASYWLTGAQVQGKDSTVKLTVHRLSGASNTFTYRVVLVGVAS